MALWIQFRSPNPKAQNSRKAFALGLKIILAIREASRLSGKQNIDTPHGASSLHIFSGGWRQFPVP